MGRRRRKLVRYRMKGRRGHHRIFISVISSCIGILLAIICIHWLEQGIRPQLVGLARTEVSDQITRMANEVILAELRNLNGEELLPIQSRQVGEMTALTADMVRLNRLRLRMVEGISRGMDGLREHILRIPVGSVTGLDLLSGHGPGIPVQIRSVSSVEADFRNEFTSAGINQTLHRVWLDIRVNSRLLLPGGMVETRVETPVCASETLIIGTVPEFYYGRSNQ